MKQLIKQISTLDFGITGMPLAETDAAQAQKELSAGGYPCIPVEVLEFLQHYNGFLSDGRCVWGIDNHNHFLYDILAENLAADNPDNQNLLLLGETETTYIGWFKKQNRYSMIDKSSFMVLHNFNNFAEAVKYILKIND